MGDKANVLPLLFSVPEAARLLSISRSKLYQMIHRGKIHSIRIGRSRRLALKDLERWIQRQKRHNGQEVGSHD